MQCKEGTMESLCSRLDALQEKQMDILELDAGHIADVEKYVELLRKEAMLLCAANSRGLKTVGCTAVPGKQACESNARQTIQLHLLICSLRKSSFANEQWRLSDLTFSMYMCPPRETFKKKGRNVTVMFDDDPSNCMEYTLWSKVYVETEENAWECVESHIDGIGIYYCVQGITVYYVKFLDECKKYGSTCKWKLVDGANDIASLLVSSTTCAPEASCQQPILPETSGRQEDTTDRGAFDPDKYTPPRKRYRFAASEKPTPQPPVPSAQPPLPEATTSPTPAPTAAPPTTPATPSGSDSPSITFGSGGSSTGGSGDSGGSVSDISNAGRSSNCDCDCGTSTGVRTGFYIPAVLIAGGPNQVKCLRWRLKKKYRGTYKNCSTTWTWVDDDGLTRTCSHRICVSFCCKIQRNCFLQCVPLPQGTVAAVAELPF
ncbi:E2 protein [Phocoena phocoena papillomavirus 2]|uniref:Regulatory protein E2 n=1 Tax=Phocoena phocoena papillomavirus 2 TaxID=706526 RepID=F2VIR4_9PAPI|nr:E2 protein [Phocoena phocoena papillomavirus 2]ADJ96349.1 E2 protein [Phocoena phocoena papillomavirus 2]